MAAISKGTLPTSHAQEAMGLARVAPLLFLAWLTRAEERTCGDFLCPDGFRRRAVAGEVDPTLEQCCERLCSFSCPKLSGYVPRGNASAGSLAVCCQKAPPCVANSRYVPLGVPAEPTKTASSIECAQRCQASAGCIGFSWLADSSCHLAAANATLRFLPGGVSGNRTCHATRPMHQQITGPRPEVVHEHCQRQAGRCWAERLQGFNVQVCWHEQANLTCSAAGAPARHTGFSCRSAQRSCSHPKDPFLNRHRVASFVRVRMLPHFFVGRLGPVPPRLPVGNDRRCGSPVSAAAFRCLCRSRLPLTTKTIIAVGSYYEVQYRNCREPAKSWLLVVEDEQAR